MRRLSLKWKVLGVLTFALGGIFTAFHVIEDRALREQLDHYLASDHLRYREEFAGLLDDSVQALRSFGELLQTIPEINAAIERGDGPGIIAAMEPYWPTVQLEMSLERVAFYDREGRLLGDRQVVEQRQPLPESLRGLLTRAVEEEVPAAALDCRSLCYQVVALPTLVEGEVAGATLLTRTLDALIEGLRKVSGTDVGVLAPAPASPSRLPLSPWRLAVFSFSHGRDNLELMRAYAETYPGLAQRGGVATLDGADGRSTALHLLPYAAPGEGQSARIAVLADIGGTREQIHQARLRNLLTGVVGLILAEALLLAVVWRPLSRVRRLADLLPLLAERRHDRFRELLGRRPASHLSDEVDVLEESAAALSRQLKRLEEEVAERNRELAGRVEELAREKERYALSAQGANDGLWDWDLRAGTIYYSPRWKGMLGLAEEAVGERPEEWLGRILEEDREAVERALERHLRRESDHFGCEYRVRHADGELRWMLCRGLALWDEERQPYRISGSQTDITESKRTQQQLLHDALHDGLTGLANRTLLMGRLQHCLERSSHQPDYRFALLFLDLDRFKIINDSLGHLAGDHFLTMVARRLDACMRPDDTVARFGGDEFMVLLDPVAGLEEAEAFARRIGEVIYEPLDLEGHVLRATTSIGIVANDAPYRDPLAMLRDADNALHWAKSRGRGNQVVFTPSMHERAVSILSLEHDLRRGVEEGELELHFQSIHRIPGGELTGWEALVRWRHPERGLVSPLEFIPIAEETGLIVPMGRWILRRAAAQIAAWRQRYPEALAGHSVNVNLSPLQFADPELMALIREAVAEYRLPPGSLKFEITESALMDEPERARRVLEEIQRLRFPICIDDFGTGYSSLSQLHQFPIDVLKVDRAFVKGLTADCEGGEIARAVIALAHSLECRVVAEGVENEDHLRCLHAMGCEYAQGFHFSRPLPVAEVEQVLERLYGAPSV